MMCIYAEYLCGYGSVDVQWRVVMYGNNIVDFSFSVFEDGIITKLLGVFHFHFIGTSNCIPHTQNKKNWSTFLALFHNKFYLHLYIFLTKKNSFPFYHSKEYHNVDKLNINFWPVIKH